jgi:protein FRG1
MVKPLSFKGDKKSGKKRKRAPADDGLNTADPGSTAVTTTSTTAATTSTTAPEDDSWVGAEAITDISGPVILVLPTDTPSALSCDVNGKIFTIPIENMIDGDATTAEPHDVRQVWIANRTAGTEKLSFKGHHGKYLHCDKFGVPSATREAIGPEESFTCIAVSDNLGAFAIQTERDNFFTVDQDATASDKVVRGDAETIDFNSSFRIRLQARFKPSLRVAKEDKVRERISRKELEDMVGHRLEDDVVKMLKRARREGDFHEKMLDVKVKGKHDKFA